MTATAWRNEATPQAPLMRALRRVALLSFAAVAVASCGKEPTSPYQPPPPLAP